MEKKAVLHARVSGRHQRENSSIPTQLACMRQYAAEQGMQIVAETVDIDTGRHLQRSGLDKALAMIDAEQANVLVVYQLDRLTRDFLDSHLVRRRLLQAGVELHYARTGRQAGLTPDDRIVDDQEARAAEIELAQIIERTTRGRLAKLKNGRWLGGGHVPYGYRAVGERNTRTLVVNDDHADIVRLMFKWFVSGDETGVPLSVPAIPRKLTALKIPTPHDVRGWANKKRAYAEWSAHSIYPILRHKGYIGKFVHNRTRMLPDGRRCRTEPEAWIEVDVPPLLDDPNLWLAAQAKLDAFSQRVKPRNKHQYLLSQRLTCVCGYHLIGSASMRKPYGPYLYYRCAGARYQNAYGCDIVKGLRVDKLDRQVWNWMKTSLSMLDTIVHEHDEQSQTLQQYQAMLDAQRYGLLQERAEIEQQLQRALELYVRGTIPVDALDAQVARCQAQLTELDARIATAAHDTVLTKLKERVAQLRQMATTLQGDDVADPDFATKRTLVEAMDVQVRLVRQTDEVWLHITSNVREDTIRCAL